MNEVLQKALTALEKAGSQRSEVVFTRSEVTEFNLETGEPTLMRTVHNANVSLTAMVGCRKGVTVVNDLEQLDEAARDVTEQAKGAGDDEANDIAALEEGQTIFSHGPLTFDADRLYQRLDEFLTETKTRFPKIVLVDGYCKYVRTDRYVANTNKVEFEVFGGYYELSLTFCAKDGDRASSMNGSGAARVNLDEPFMEWGGLGLLFEQSIRELDAAPLGDKFVGDIITMPFVTEDLVQSYQGCFLKDGCLIAGTSLLRDKIGETVAADCVNIIADPQDPRLLPQALTADNYRARPVTVLEKGVLKSFLLGQYGANKTGLGRTGNQGDMSSLTPGQDSLESLIASVDKGILMGRFSGGTPNDKGDLTGVAKNSFLIENGKIGRPIQETMIACNLLEMFRHVEGITQEVLNIGYNAQPWVRFSGISISG